MVFMTSGSASVHNVHVLIWLKGTWHLLLGAGTCSNVEATSCDALNWFINTKRCSDERIRLWQCRAT